MGLFRTPIWKENWLLVLSRILVFWVLLRFKVGLVVFTGDVLGIFGVAVVQFIAVEGHWGVLDELVVLLFMCLILEFGRMGVVVVHDRSYILKVFYKYLKFFHWAIIILLYLSALLASRQERLCLENAPNSKFIKIANPMLKYNQTTILVLFLTKILNRQFSKIFHYSPRFHVWGLAGYYWTIT